MPRCAIIGNIYDIRRNPFTATFVIVVIHVGHKIDLADSELCLKIGEQVGASIAGPAVAAMQDDMRNENWPAGTLKSTQFELRALFDLPPVSEMPPER